MSVKPIPEGFNTINLYIIVKNAEEAMTFYEKAFGAKRGAVMKAPDGGTMHAEVIIGNSTLMLTDENLDWGLKSPQTLGGNTSSMHLYVEDADAVFNQAVAAGCEVRAPLMDAFWGDRYGKLADPFGHEWGIATHLEELTEEELTRRGAEFFKQMAEQGGSC